MAIYFLNLKTFGRSGGSSSVSAAAYRSGERIRDERTGRTYDHTDRQDILHKEILVPSEFAGSDMGWAFDRDNLWNTAESAESRKNARVAREYLVALPAELDPEQQLRLVRGFSRELTDRYRFALDVSVHEPRRFPGSDPRNFHAHLLATTREVTPTGLAAKTTLELSDSKRRELGLVPAIHEFLHVRERWATVTNAALRDANIDARIDHRSLQAQGIDREPYPHIPRAAYEMERHGYRSDVAERLRADYEARVAARGERAMSHDGAAATMSDTEAGAAANRAEYQARQGEPEQRRSEQRQPEPMRSEPKQSELRQPDQSQTAQDQSAPRAPTRRQYQSLEDIRRQAREDWLKMRKEAAEASGASSPSAKHTRDDGLSR